MTEKTELSRWINGIERKLTASGIPVSDFTATAGVSRRSWYNYRDGSVTACQKQIRERIEKALKWYFGNRLFLPLPPSTNNLFENPKGRSGKRNPTKRYEQWKAAASLALSRQQVHAVMGPVQVRLVVGRCSDSRDADNCAKAPLDFLVKNKLIEGDNRTCVRRLVIEWDDDLDGIMVIFGTYIPNGAADDAIQHKE